MASTWYIMIKELANKNFKSFAIGHWVAPYVTPLCKYYV